LLAGQVINISMGIAMRTIVSDYLLPRTLNFNLKLDHESRYPAPRRCVRVSFSNVLPIRNYILFFCHSKMMFRLISSASRAWGELVSVCIIILFSPIHPFGGSSSKSIQGNQPFSLLCGPSVLCERQVLFRNIP
jgi:hypothetical protein